jgi:hypothetical protein
MSEGGIYLCNWKRVEGVYSLELLANSNISAYGKDLKNCKEDICMEIISWNGDGEAVLELFPPEYGKKYKGGAQLFSTVGYNDSTRAVDYAGLFVDGVCSMCKHGLGARSSMSLTVETPPTGMVCGIDACYPAMRVYSKLFIAELTEEEKSSFSIRPVLHAGNESGYFEILPKNTIPTVGYKGAEYPTTFLETFECADCGRKKFSVWAEELSYDADFVDARDIDGLSDSMIFIDVGWNEAMAFRAERWREILANKRLKGLCSGKLIVLDPSYVEAPKFKVVDEFDWVT